jgi:hypothetical protein
MSRAPKRSSRTSAVTPETVRALIQALPETEEGPSYGTPGFRVCGKLFARLHEDGESLVVRIEQDDRAMRMRADPDTYYITDHYLNYPWMLVRLSSVSRADLRDLLRESWALRAPKRLLAKS